jgi:hypothetical protein
MTSQLNVDTIVDKAGSGGATLSKPILTGMTSASTYTSEGGAKTANNIVQGLAKAWVSKATDSSQSVAGDSFNGSSFTDNATGSSDITMINIMNNAEFCVQNTTTSNYPYYGSATSTSNYRLRTVNSSGGSADGAKNGTVYGDLA